MALKYDKQSISAARMILDHPVVGEIFDNIEAEALNSAVNAKSTDTEIVGAHLAEVRAIRKFRSSLNFLLTTGEAALKRDQAAK